MSSNQDESNGETEEGKDEPTPVDPSIGSFSALSDRADGNSESVAHGETEAGAAPFGNFAELWHDINYGSEEDAELEPFPWLEDPSEVNAVGPNVFDMLGMAEALPNTERDESGKGMERKSGGNEKQFCCVGSRSDGKPSNGNENGAGDAGCGGGKNAATVCNEKRVRSVEDPESNTDLLAGYLCPHDKQEIKHLAGKENINLLKIFMKEKGFLSQHIDSYNHFLNFEIMQIFNANRRITSDVPGCQNWYMEYTDIKIGTPRYINNYREEAMTPHECRLRELTYAAPIIASIQYPVGTRVMTKVVDLGEMPIMVRSNKCVLSKMTRKTMHRLWECPNDPGGYFIIRGQEKVILAQEQGAKNRMIVDEDKNGYMTCYATSFTYERKSRTTVIHKKGSFYLSHNSFDSEVPVLIIFYALGIASDKMIYDMVCQGDEEVQRALQKSFMEFTVYNIHKKEDAITFLKTRLKGSGYLFGRVRTNEEEVNFLLRGLMLAHVIDPDDTNICKAWYLALMVRRCAMAVDNPKLKDDRDHYGNKRLELAGQLLSLLFEDLVKRMNWDLKSRADKCLPKSRDSFDISTQINPSIITSGLRNAISSGNWTLKRFRLNRAGISQVLSRLSFVSALGTIGRVQAQFEKSRKVAGPRAVHASQWGVICPVDTPEGESCGLLKALAMTAQVAVEETEDTVREVLFELDQITPVNNETLQDLCKMKLVPVFLNGVVIGLISNEVKFVNAVRMCRRLGKLSPFLSVSYSKLQNCVLVSCDGGRLCRPYIVVEDGVSKLTDWYKLQIQNNNITWKDLLSAGIIEYLDVNELNNALIADFEEDLNCNFTHLTIAPFTILGVVAGLIPFPQHNQSPRNTYQCAMGKQSMGLVGLNAPLRYDTVQYGLVYPQLPLVTTAMYDMVNLSEMPAGQNAMVAVMSFTGYDIEDAVILNKASLDRGFALCTVHEKHSVHVKTVEKNGKMELLKDPNTDLAPAGSKVNRINLIEPDGIIASDVQVFDRGCLINKAVVNVGKEECTPEQLNEKPLQYDRLFYDHWDPAYSESIMITAGKDEDNIVKLKTRQTRAAEVGDKFSSRHGQKGVVGLIVEQTDMPYTEDGICPDLIMNPHGFPSRMTVGKLIECLAGKTAAITGEIQDSTAFQSVSQEYLMDQLTSRGYNYISTETMVAGIDGKLCDAHIFSGPIYYQRLKHMVADKIHARGEGPVQQLSRQPTEGRSRDGGLRLGEMERDCLVAHGTVEVIRERFLISSDHYNFDICSKCGILSNMPAYCTICSTGAHVKSVSMPYSFKLMVQELMSMNIVPRFRLDGVGSVFPGQYDVVAPPQPRRSTNRILATKKEKSFFAKVRQQEKHKHSPNLIQHMEAKDESKSQKNVPDFASAAENLTNIHAIQIPEVTEPEQAEQFRQIYDVNHDEQLTAEKHVELHENSKQAYEKLLANF